MKIQNLFDIKDISEINQLTKSVSFYNLMDAALELNFYLREQDINIDLPHIFCLGQGIDGVHFIANNKTIDFDGKKMFDSKTIMGMTVAYLSKNNSDIHFLENHSLMKFIELESFRANHNINKLDFSFFSLRVAKVVRFKKCDS